MKQPSKEYVVESISDTIKSELKMGVTIPELSDSRISFIADSILFELNGLDDPDVNFSELVKWNLFENLTHS
jgi:hypothetical protein